MAAAMVAVGLLGCDGGSRQTAAPTTNPVAAPVVVVSPAPSTQPVTVTLLESPATAPATQPAQSTLNIGLKEFAFPQAVLRFSKSGGLVIARLMTDDPPAAIEADYRGNSFDLIMSLDIADPSRIDQAVWKYTSGANVREDDSPHGIFLEGQRLRLHPQDVTARFQQDGDKVIVDLSGWFLLYDSTVNDRPFAQQRRVLVQGRMETTVSKQ
jgi:hypothetical protein